MNGRSPKRVATTGLVLCTVLFTMAMRINDLPLIGPGQTSYSAEFSDASGLRVGDRVQVAGVTVGRVKSIDIEFDHVVIDFEMESEIELGETTRAAIAVGSLLGLKYLDVTPHGGSPLDAGATIPLKRTTPAYDVVEAFEDLTEVTAQVDTEQLAASLDALADTFRNSRPQVRSALRGLSRFSEVIASRDREIKELLRHADTTAGVLDRRRDDVVDLIKASNLLLAELQRRKDAVHALLVNTKALAEELRGLVEDNQEALTPALRELESITRMLSNHQKKLREVVRNSENYVATFNNVVGSGPWFDVVIPRLPSSVDRGGN
ncbi:MCE family protein [Nocardioides limicola]|uniref:MCE family protein n=1 Tax=Nocardioides limicola TaxID=2803368 RepID=UPI00193AF197|nr:MCE family protein [Nocardioides sp. DJM-14]